MNWHARILGALLLLTPLVSAAAQVANDANYDFAWDIAPRLTQAGCASAECHGGATGRGGMKLSLFGTDPRADYAAIVEDLDGRRIDRLDPARSLILRKPTLDLDHGGGLRWNEEDHAVQVLREWITAGAPYRGAEAFQPVALELLLEERGEGSHVRAIARDADGNATHVTDRVVFQCSDPFALRVRQDGRLDEQNPQAKAWIFARLGQLDARVYWRGSQSIEVERVEERADESRLLRRLYFDLLERWPTADDQRRYFAAAPQSRYAAEVRRLLDGAEFAARFDRFLDAWLERPAMAPSRSEEAVFKLDRIARETLNRSARAAAWNQRRDPRDRAEAFAKSYLGLRLECARCHNHPFDRWTQDDHLSFAALFVDARPDGAAGKFFDPEQGAVIAPRFLDRSSDADRSWSEPAALANWLIADQRERFAINAANRLIAWTLGRGLVEPLDDHRTTNPPLDEALLAEVTEQLLASSFDVRDTLFWLLNTDLYQRATRVSHGALEESTEPDLLAARPVRVLDRDELLRAVCRALDAPDPETGASASPLSSELELLHGERIEAALHAPGNLLSVLAEFGGADEVAMIEELYLALLTRSPTAAELSVCQATYSAAPSSLAGLRAVARAMILTREIGAHR